MTSTPNQADPICSSAHPRAKPMIKWMGGKRRLAAQILPQFATHTCYVEAFAGAGALFFAKEPAQTEVLNDLNGELVNLYRVVQHHLEEFVRQFKWALTSREIYKWQQMTQPETLTDIQRAARFYYLQNLGFGGKVTGQTYGTVTTGKPGLNLLRLEENLSAVHLRLHQVQIERLDWQACVQRYDRQHTLFYLDPPYWATAGYGLGFEFEQYEAMSDLLRSMKGKALISINDHPDIRECFKGLPMQALQIKYTVGKAKDGKRRESGELLIANYPLR